MRVCMYVAYMRACMRVCVCMYMRACMRVCMYVHVRMSVSMQVCNHKHNKSFYRQSQNKQNGNESKSYSQVVRQKSMG